MKLGLKNGIYPSLTWLAAPHVTAKSLVYWTAYFDILYYSAISPFRLRWNRKKESWEISTNRVQKVNIRF